MPFEHTPDDEEFSAELPEERQQGDQALRQKPEPSVPGTGRVSSALFPTAAPSVTLHGGSVPVRLHVNGRNYTLDLEPRVTLLDALRERLHLTGTKKGCDHGQCGACTVLIGDRRTLSCMTLAITQEDARITTVEGLANGKDLHPLQAAFLAHDAFQCGFCTPGQLCSAMGLLLEGKPSDDEAIREGMSGNICRCGAYPNILAAIRDVRDNA